MSHIMGPIFFILFYFFSKSSEASPLRAFYQRGLPYLVLTMVEEIRILYAEGRGVIGNPKMYDFINKETLNL